MAVLSICRSFSWEMKMKVAAALLKKSSSKNLTNESQVFQAKYGGQLFYHHKHFLLTFWITQFSEATSSSGLKRELEGKSRKTSLYCGYSTTTWRSSGQQKIVEFLRANKPYEQLFKNETLTPHKNGSNAAREIIFCFVLSIEFSVFQIFEFSCQKW